MFGGAGLAPAEESEDEGGVRADVREGPEEVIGAEAVGKGAKNLVDRIGGAALLESGCEVEDEVGVSDARLLWRVIGEGTDVIGLAFALAIGDIRVNEGG